MNYHFFCIRALQNKQNLQLTEEIIKTVDHQLNILKSIENKSKGLHAARNAFVKAPSIPDLGISLIQIWQGIEALFPSVNMEVSHRLSLLLSQLNNSEGTKLEVYEKAKKSYSIRSKIAHGANINVTTEHWFQAWQILLGSIKSVIDREYLPSEDELIHEMLK